ncbi:DUF2971 domain-containing protein [Paracoccus aerodenitrificans]|uniref:DUF2971 domain-containing protein n=1 Tax=Paracoccus aerodenitrificans TaxID=3017781 RepID=UPI0022F135C9|nr:DUF2971 domain-containing protein [Paracoccus aerodenitrificans]WBU63613.1 DUF2971 domain-containing protein [Paracoccus aerodenitrificans]
MDTFSLDDFDNPPPPPRYLYKYLSAERVGNVLEGGTVRFTPLLDTNDTFEVRSTFDKLAGPKMLSMLAEQMDNTLSEESVRKLTADMLKENGLGFLPPDLALQIAEQHYGGNFMGMLRQQMQQAVDTMLVPHFNDPENAKKLLEKLGRDLLCFSLSERMDSPPMWAHYADNNAGFVVAFDTENAWFHQRKNGEKTRLQKVAYFDGKLDEPLENPQAAFISKTTDWAYEREWRLYIKNGEADLTVGNADDPIQLLKFPPEAVDRIILGAKTRPEIADRIRDAVASRYPHAPVMRAVPNRQSHTYDEVSE